MVNRKNWTKEDDKRLIYNAQSYTINELALLLNRSFNGVRARKLTLKITKPRSPNWTTKEITYLRQAYQRGTKISFIARKLNRSVGSIMQRLQKHKIYRKNSNKRP